jgi:trans-2,3-dihydro-3-hydroxyanthranilate isomerase
MSRKYYITEVFAEGPYAGNQLATLPDAADISSVEMQKIARAFNFAETTFITGGSEDDGFDVRIFTPASELPFAGHPTLGTSFLIRNEIYNLDADNITLNLGVGQIPVRFEADGVIWMRQNEPVFGEALDKTNVASGLGINVDQIHPDFPCQVVSTGLEFALVPVTSYEALKAAFVAGGNLAKGCLVFCAGGYTTQQEIQARMFAGALGVSEDPATGSANGCLAAYLAEYEFFGTSEVSATVGQGYEIQRPSQLYLKSSKRSGQFLIEVGGRVQLLAEGQWLA